MDLSLIGWKSKTSRLHTKRKRAAAKRTEFANRTEFTCDSCNVVFLETSHVIERSRVSLEGVERSVWMVYGTPIFIEKQLENVSLLFSRMEKENHLERTDFGLHVSFQGCIQTIYPFIHLSMHLLLYI